jgi:hypothetical protein
MSERQPHFVPVVTVLRPMDKGGESATNQRIAHRRQFPPIFVNRD